MDACSRFASLARLALAIILLVPGLGHASDAAIEAGAGTPRFTLKSSTLAAAPLQAGRYSLRARFAPAESAGELREGNNYTLIGRLAKGGVNCGIGGPIFSDGFEGN